MPPRPSRRRVLLSVLLLALGAGALIAGYLLQWDRQLGLYWSERSVSPAARAAGIWLPDYRLARETTLQGLEQDETSGLTWNPPSDTLFTVTGKHPKLVELSRDGRVLRSIELVGFADPEAVEALGDGRLAIVDERQHLLAVFRLAADAQRLDLADTARYDLGFADAGNKGFEGLAWNPHTQRLLLAKERDPLGLFSLPLPAAADAGVTLEALPSANLPLRDLSSLTVDPRSGRTLLLSDESRLLLELDEQGKPLSFLSLSGGRNGLGDGIQQAEGVTMDAQGNIYLVGEPNRFYVFSRQPGSTPR